MAEVIKHLEIESSIKGAIKNQKLLLAFNWALFIITSLFFVLSAYALTTKQQSNIITIPIGIYILTVLTMFTIHIFTSIAQIQFLIKRKTVIKIDWLRAFIPIIMGIVAVFVLGFEGYRFLCLNKSVSKLSRPLALFKLLISGTVIIQSGSMIWSLSNPFAKASTASPFKSPNALLQEIN